MPMSEYVQSPSEQWALIGGGVEPGEEPAEALVREVLEEMGADICITGLVGAYGGEPMMRTYGNGDRAGYVTVAYECRLLSAAAPDMDELIELGWFERTEIGSLARQGWIDRIISDAPVA